MKLGREEQQYCGIISSTFLLVLDLEKGLCKHITFSFVVVANLSYYIVPFVWRILHIIVTT